MSICHRKRFTLLLLVLLVCSCGQKSSQDSYANTVVDPDGISAIENGPIPQQWDGSLPTLNLETLATVGAEEGPDEQLISSAGFYMQVATGPDGQVGYVERVPTELRVYDSGGNFLWRAGRSGEGPGEWRNASHLEYVTNTGWVLRTYPDRLLIFSETGTMVESRSVRDVPGIRSSYLRSLHPSGVMWSWTLDASNQEISYGHLFRGDWITLDSVEIDTVLNSTLTYEGSDSAYLTLWPRSMSADPDGRLWLNHSFEYQIEVYEVVGNDRWRVRRQHKPVPYTHAKREQTESTPTAGMPGRTIYIRLPKNRPSIQELKWVDNNELWVFTSTYVDSPFVQVDVFDMDGIYIRAFKADESLRWGCFQDDTVWQLKENEEGVPQLIRSRYWVEY